MLIVVIGSHYAAGLEVEVEEEELIEEEVVEVEVEEDLDKGRR